MRLSTFYDVENIYLDGMLKMWYIFERQVFSSIYNQHQLETKGCRLFLAGNFSPF